jgi:transposase
MRRGIGECARQEDADPSARSGGAGYGVVEPDLLEFAIVIQIAPQMRILVAVEAIDLRRGIDGLARVCKDALNADPFSGALFVFRNRKATTIKIMVYDGQGFWLCQKRLSKGRFRWWPADNGQTTALLEAHQLQLLIAAGNPAAAQAAPMWRRITPTV